MNSKEPPLVWVDGQFVDSGAPVIAADDPGFLLGLAVFDTLLCEGGRLYFVDDHLARLREGADAIGIEAPADEVLRSALDQMARALRKRTTGIRITLTPGAPGQGVRLVLTTRAFEPAPKEGVSILLVPRAKVSGHGVEGVKTTSRARNVLALDLARARGAFEALLGTDEGDLSEGTYSNFFVVLEGELRTPSLDRGCLPGILRMKLLEIARDLDLAHRECPVDMDDLRRADEVFLTNSLSRIVPVTEILDLRADLPVGGGVVTRRLVAALDALERGSE